MRGARVRVAAFLAGARRVFFAAGGVAGSPVLAVATSVVTAAGAAGLTAGAAATGAIS